MCINTIYFKISEKLWAKNNLRQTILCGIIFYSLSPLSPSSKDPKELGISHLPAVAFACFVCRTACGRPGTVVAWLGSMWGASPVCWKSRPTPPSPSPATKVGRWGWGFENTGNWPMKMVFQASQTGIEKWRWGFNRQTVGYNSYGCAWKWIA